VKFANSKTPKIQKPIIAALTIIEVIVLIAVIALLVGLILPEFATYHIGPSYNCLSNLNQIGLACRTWEGDHSDRFPMWVPASEGGAMGSTDAFRYFTVMSNEISGPKILACPQDQRKSAPAFEKIGNANVSYFVGLDADEKFPTRILAGDRNLLTNGVAVHPGLTAITTNQAVSFSGQIHKFSGNFVLADGSARYVTNSDLQTLFQNTGLATNRLAMP